MARESARHETYPGSGPFGEVTPLILPCELISTEVTELLLELFGRRREKGLGHHSASPMRVFGKELTRTN